MDGKGVSICVITRDRLDELVRCIEALAANTGEVPAWQLVLIDDGSTDGTADFVRCLEGDVVVRRHDLPRGDAEALRAALRAASHDTVVLLDPAVQVQPGWLEPLVVTLARPEVAAAAPALIDAGGRVVHAGLTLSDTGEPMPMSSGIESATLSQGARPVDALDTACLATTASLLTDCPLDPRMPSGLRRAADLTRRLGAHGDLRVVPVSRVCTDTPTHDDAEGRFRYLVRWSTDPDLLGLSATIGPESAVVTRLERNGQTFDELTERAVDAAGAGRHEEALSLAQAAAHHGWLNHSGRFTDQRLERAVLDVGADVAVSRRRGAPSEDDRETVLHVLSEAATKGGHTRLAWRWMQRDTDRRHVVALTHQGRRRVPVELTDSAEVHRIDSDADGLVDRVGRLKGLVAHSDLVVLHTHPYDAVAPAALAGARPPVVLTNHAGHVFWLGTGVADVVACLRPATAELTAARRGVDRSRIVTLPSPVDPAATPDDPTSERRRLGIADDRIVLLTIASHYKYAPAADLGFVDLIAPVLEAHPEAVLLAVGPRPDRAWQQLASDHPGQVVLAGEQAHLGPFHAAADVYVDSYPLPSTTAMLEAVLGGRIPAVAFRPWGDGDVLTVDDIALDTHLLGGCTAEAFEGSIAYLIGDEEERRRRGEASAVAVAAFHGRSGWARRLEAVYAQARRVPPVGVEGQPAATPTSTAPLDQRLLALHEAGGVTVPVGHVLRRHNVSTPTTIGAPR